MLDVRIDHAGSWLDQRCCDWSKMMSWSRDADRNTDARIDHDGLDQRCWAGARMLIWTNDAALDHVCWLDIRRWAGPRMLWLTMNSVLDWWCFDWPRMLAVPYMMSCNIDDGIDLAWCPVQRILAGLLMTNDNGCTWNAGLDQGYCLDHRCWGGLAVCVNTIQCMIGMPEVSPCLPPSGLYDRHLSNYRL